MYTTYTYYQDNYKGSIVPSSDLFDCLAIKAEKKLNQMTFNSILLDTELTAYPDNIQMCVCELCDTIYLKESQNNDISSEKVGDYSVSYIKDTEVEYEAKLKRIIKEWLWDTGYLYSGVIM